jgi:hypothetical protein
MILFAFGIILYTNAMMIIEYLCRSWEVSFFYGSIVIFWLTGSGFEQVSSESELGSLDSLNTVFESIAKLLLICLGSPIDSIQAVVGE